MNLLLIKTIFKMTKMGKILRDVYIRIKKNKNVVYLICAMFFLPLGYDYIFKTVMDWVNDYWIADLIFYAISGIFFILYYIKNK